MIITIDGQGSVGKGTLAKKLSEHFGFAYFDTGMLYRAVALEMLLQGQDMTEEAKAVEFAKNLTYEKMMELSLSPEFRGPETTRCTAMVASYAKVREYLLEIQRDFAKTYPDAIFDGRDMGTVVFPGADLKFFIIAKAEVKAMRRYKYYQEKGIEASYEKVLEEAIARDESDASRAVAPLRPAEDAIMIDTSDMNAEEVFELASGFVKEKMK